MGPIVGDLNMSATFGGCPLGGVASEDARLVEVHLVKVYRAQKSWKIMENHGHNDYGHFWQFYGEIIFK